MKEMTAMLNDKLMKFLDDIQCTLQVVIGEKSLAYAGGMYSFSCTSRCSGDCSGDCQGTCEDACYGCCVGDCAGTCESNCDMECDHSAH